MIGAEPVISQADIRDAAQTEGKCGPPSTSQQPIQELGMEGEKEEHLQLRNALKPPPEILPGFPSVGA